MPKASEVAKLTVGGASFEDWDTVWVQHRWMDGWPQFRFSCAERAPLPTLWRLMQFKPGDPVTIWLGGILAITGIITQRQTSYDATNHAVLLTGVGRQWGALTSSVNSATGTYEGNVKAVVGKVLSEVGGKLKPVGTLDESKFDPPVQRNPGELVFDFIDRVARMKSANIGSDHEGNTLLIGEHTGQVQQQLTEGENILKMQCVFSNEATARLYKLKGQAPINDDTAARAAAHMETKAEGTLRGVFKYLEFVTEQPVRDISALLMRLNYEAIHAEGTQIRAYVTVQGWLRDGLTLWRTGDNVMVKSPMAMLEMIMKVQTATFTQDNRGGTITVLELVLPWMLGDRMYITDPGPGVPQPPAPATISSNTAATLAQMPTDI